MADNTSEYQTQAAIEHQDQSLSRQAGLYVSKGSVWFVTLLLLLLFLMAYYNQTLINSFGGTTVAEVGQDAPCISELCLRFLLEGEHLRMQTAKVNSVAFQRFSLSSMGFIASLVTIVLGSVLIFDRVRASSPDHARVSMRDYFLSFRSTFPGSLMVALGTFSLVINLYMSGPGMPPIYVETWPLYMADSNPHHQALGRINATAQNMTRDDVAQQRRQQRVLPSVTLPTGAFEGDPSQKGDNK